MRVFLFIFILFPLLATAEKLPTLQGLDDPNWGSGQTIADDKFPEYLEKNEDYTSAIVEWQRVIYRTSNQNIQKRAYFKIANLYNKLNNHPKALKAYENYLSRYPKTSRKPFILSQIHRLSLLTGDSETAATIRKQMLKLEKSEKSDAFKESIEQADLYELWLAGLQAKDTFIETHSEKGSELKDLLKKLPTQNHEQVKKATLLSLFPGGGYFYLGFVNWGVLIFMINLSFFYALLNAMKQKHWGYGLAFGSMAAFIYIGSMFYSSTLATEKAYFTRLEAMKTWDDLKPKAVDDFNNTPKAIQPFALSPHSKL